MSWTNEERELYELRCRIRRLTGELLGALMGPPTPIRLELARRVAREFDDLVEGALDEVAL